jgi:hypothetical protein
MDPDSRHTGIVVCAGLLIVMQNDLSEVLAGRRMDVYLNLWAYGNKS